MLTPPTTIPGTGPSLHDFGLAMLIMVGFVLIAGWLVGPKRRHPRRKVGTVAPLRPWKGPDGKVDYQLYLRSGRWSRVKRRTRRRDRGRCQWPDTTPGQTVYQHGCRHPGSECHHMTYVHLGAEKKDETVMLCRTHHGMVPTRPHPPLELQQGFFGIKGPFPGIPVAAPIPGVMVTPTL